MSRIMPSHLGTSAKVACLLFALSPLSLRAQPASGSDLETIPVEAIETADTPSSTEQVVQKLKAVQVTGSRIRRTEMETEQPIVTISQKDLERSGLTTIGEVLGELSAAGSALNTTINNGGTGATEVDLRNLGSNRVLVLIDGHRWVNGLRSLSTNSVDLNTIPLAIIERIDVLQDGASAAYGSDAITGVVNIITKKQIDGLNLSSQYGAYTQGDGQQQLHSITAGQTFSNWFAGEETSVFGSFSFQDQKSVFAGNRSISAFPTANTGLTRGSSFTPEGRFLFLADESNSGTAQFDATKCPSIGGDVAQGAIDEQGLPITLPPQVAQARALRLCDITHVTGAPTGGPDSYRAFTAANDAYNYALTNYLATPFRTYNGFIGLQHRFNDWVQFSTQMLYSRRESKQQLAPQPIAVGDISPVIGGLIPGQTYSYNQATFIAPGNTFNPTRSNGQDGQYIGHLVSTDPTNDPNSEAFLGLNYTGAALRRMVEGDPRIQIQKVPTRFIRSGFSGDFIALVPVNWELGFSYGDSEQKQVLLNQYRMDRIQQAIVGNRGANDENPDNVPLCVAPCVPLNLFGGPGSITREMLDFILYDNYNSTKSSQQDIYLNLSTEVPVAFLPADLGIAFGLEQRSNNYSDNPSVEQIEGTTSGLTATPTQGSIKAKEAFMELDVPLLKDVPMFHDLGLSLAGRVSDYGSLGKSKNGKLGLRYRPVSDLLVRGTFSTSFRAPNTGELFLSNAGSFPALVDPCASPEEGSVTETNCNAAGVSPYTQTVVQFYSPFTGNRELKSERSHSLTAGLVFSPASIKGLDFSVDYFRIKLDDFISPPGAQFILDQCYTTTGQAFCEFVTRNPNNQQLVSVLNSFQNFPSIDTSGIDFSFNYALPKSDALGRFKISSTATFLSSYGQTVTGADGVTQERTGYAGTNDSGQPLPRWKINPSLQWSNGAWNSSLNTRIVWSYTETCDDGFSPSLSDLGLCSDPNNRNKEGTLAPRNKVAYAWKTDFQLGYNYKPASAQFSIGLENLFDRDPPVSYSAFANSFDSSYWIPGRLIYGSVKKDF